MTRGWGGFGGGFVVEVVLLGFWGVVCCVVFLVMCVVFLVGVVEF